MKASLIKWSADVQVGSNGDGAKSAPIKVIARTGDPVDTIFGPVVHDFAGMSVKPRIPVDYDHDCEDSIGYANKFDTSSGDLVCSGAIVLVAGAEDGDPDDDPVALVQKMQAGIPYQASIETSDEVLLEFVPTGTVTQVNGRQVEGPVTVVREWELKAIAICKFGVDSNTEVALQLSKNKNQKKIDGTKGFFVRMSKEHMGEDSMNEKEKQAPAVEAAAEVKTEAAVEAPKVKLSETAVEASAVEAAKAEVKEKDKAVAAVDATPVAETATQLSQTKTVDADPRAEAKRFITMFGEVAGAKYFASGISYDAAMSEHVQAQNAKIADLEKRLAAIDRGADKPVKFSATSAKSEDKPRPQGMAAVSRLSGTAKK